MPTDTSHKTAVTTTDAPAAIGPYSQAVRTGEFVFTSGQIPLDPTTGQMVTGTIAQQTEHIKRSTSCSGRASEPAGRRASCAT